MAKRWTTEGFFERRERAPSRLKLSSDKLRELWQRHQAGEATKALAADGGVQCETLRRALRKLDYLHKRGL